jgi:hypothetical protein
LKGSSHSVDIQGGSSASVERGFRLDFSLRGLIRRFHVEPGVIDSFFKAGQLEPEWRWSADTTRPSPGKSFI